jgi:hypothetical protein
MSVILALTLMEGFLRDLEKFPVFILPYFHAGYFPWLTFQRHFLHGKKGTFHRMTGYRRHE